jgi:DNA topoisomerase-1
MPSSHKLVIVESKTKADTIKKYLGPGYEVVASVGHIRDLPASADEIPEQYRGLPWARLGVNIDRDFEPIYVVSPDRKKVVTNLKAALKGADELFVATDEDREGESIGWHLVQVLKPRVPTHRMVFHEITPEAIRRALANTREIDVHLVEAQETRRVLDRLVGYTVSPLLWKKVRTGLSAGRVQSVAVRLIVMRERERIRFRSGTYWDLTARLQAQGGAFEAQLVSLGGRRIATGKDFDENTGGLIEGRDVLLLGEADARQLREGLAGMPFTVRGLEKRTTTRSPYAPFTTSSLQQEANRKLGMTSERTMRVAQALYENGHITYMRTDSVNLSQEAIEAARGCIRQRFGDSFQAPGGGRQFTTKAKGAQEAHEAIRPAGTAMRTAEEIGLRGDDARLYELIWKRTVASQMADARIDLTTATLEATEPGSGRRAEFRASGREVVFAGFLRAYVEGADDPDEALDDQNRPLPRLQEGEGVPCRELEAVGHQTRPPARYTEASLVKALESQGIGRPSTYASIINTIQQRNYVFANKARQLVPTFTAMAVTGLLEQTHPEIVDVDFTAAMERSLDEIAEGRPQPGYLRSFFHGQVEGGVQRGESLDPRTVCTITHEGIAPWVIRVGRYGPFVEIPQEEGAKPLSVSLPEDLAPGDVTREMIEALARDAKRADEPLGVDPVSGLPVFVLVGRFGPYVQLGEVSDATPKPKRTSVPRGMPAESMTLTQALSLLSLPRLLGTHPETGDEIRAGIGQYGPYVVQAKTYASMGKQDDVLNVTLARALELLAQKQARGRGRAEVAPLRELGAHPADGAPVQIFEGRYGLYAKHGDVNATLPKGADPAIVTLDQVLPLLEARKDAAPGVRKGGKAKKTTTAARAEGASVEKKKTTRAAGTAAEKKKPTRATGAANKKKATTSRATGAAAEKKKATPTTGTAGGASRRRTTTGG